MSRAAIASPELCEFVLKQAPSHQISADAPDTWAKLKAWHQRWHDHAMATGDCYYVLPIYGGGCEHTIYPTPAINHAFRAWHDSIHLANDCSFNLLDEIKVGLIHMQQARKAGLSQRDQDMLIADTIGQRQYYHERNKYVHKQAEFVADVLDFGLRPVLDSGREY